MKEYGIKHGAKTAKTITSNKRTLHSYTRNFVGDNSSKANEEHGLIN